MRSSSFDASATGRLSTARPRVAISTIRYSPQPLLARLPQTVLDRLLAITLRSLMFCHLGKVEIVNRFNQVDVAWIEPKPGPANEGVDCLDSYRVRPVEAGRRPAAQPHPRLPDVIQRQRERRAFQLGQKFVSHILPVLAQRPFKPAFQTVPPCPPFLVAVEFKTALGVPGQLLAERFPKDCSSPRNS